MPAPMQPPQLVECFGAAAALSRAANRDRNLRPASKRSSTETLGRSAGTGRAEQIHRRPGPQTKRKGDQNASL